MTYPTIDQFWPAARARRFVKVGWGGAFSTYAKNMEWLAMAARVPVAQLHNINPLTFAEQQGLLALPLLGKSTYKFLDAARRGSGHEIAILTELLAAFNATYMLNEQLAILEELFGFLQLVPNFLRDHPKFCTVAMAKIAEFKDDPHAAFIRPTLLRTEAVIAAL